jgi:hypothetical protein
MPVGLPTAARPKRVEADAKPTPIFLVIAARNAAGAFLGSGQSRQKQCRENRNNSDYDEQFNQRERTSPAASVHQNPAGSVKAHSAAAP